MSLMSALARVARPAVLRALEGWQVGRLTVRLPDGTENTVGHGGDPRHVTLTVEDPALFARFALQGDLGAGEAYMDGQWRADDIELFLELVLLNRDAFALDSLFTKVLNLGNDVLHRLNANTRRGSRRNIQAHYDLSNELFALFLDETMTYSSAVFESRGETLAAAQNRKYRMLAEKVQLGPGDHLLEIGCGWGGFALFAAKQYRCRVTGITISERQHQAAVERVRRAGLEDRVSIRLLDYRDLTGSFDKIVSIEMFEALGFENWAGFFGKCDAVLAPDGLMAIQAISFPDHRFAEYRRHCDWLQKHIFPGSLLLAVGPACVEMARHSRLGLHHLEDIGIHYAETLRRWRVSFLAALPEVRALGFDDRFVRMWEYYLAMCEAAFATRTLGNLQLVLSRPGNRRLPGISEAAVPNVA
jgi:cyclopropane-fatty-acyl-phospholipid synthase